MKQILFSRFQALLTGVGLIATLTACAARPAPQAAAPTIPEVAIEFDGKEFKIPANMPGGIVALTLTNTSDKPKAIGVSRLRPGKTYADVYKLMKDHPDDFAGVFQLVSSVANVDPLAPGKPERVVADLKTGSFILDAADHFDGPSPADVPRVYREFKADQLTGQVEPSATISVELKEFAFVMPDEIKAGKQMWKVSNTGTQWHMFFVAKPNAGVSTEDALKAALADGPPAGPPPFEFVGGVAPISENERQWIEVDLKPGTYLVVCPLPDMAAMAAGGAPMSHAGHGMHKILIVK